MYQLDPSPVRRRLNAVREIPHRPNAGIASLVYLAIEAIAFLAVLFAWLFWWAATPASAAELSSPAMIAAKGSIFLGMILLGVAYLMLRAVRPGDRR